MIGEEQEEASLTSASSVMSQGIQISCFFAMTAVVRIILTVLASRQLPGGYGTVRPV